MKNNKLSWASMTALAFAIGAPSASAVDIQVAGDTTASIYGFARLNMAYNFDRAGPANETYFERVEKSDNEIGDQFRMAANTSRLGFRTSTPAAGSSIDTVFEFDFWDWDDASNARLRLASGSWNGILAGQNWSNYNTFVASTPTVNFFGTAGSNGFGSRLNQLRYTTEGFSVALEAPQVQLAPNADDSLEAHGNAVSSMPALTLRYEDNIGDFSYSVAGVARQLKYDTGNEKDTTMGYGGFVAGAYDIGPLTIRGLVNLSEGANSYLYLSGGLFNGADAYIDSNGNLQTLSGKGASVGLSYQISPHLAMNATSGFTDVDPGDEAVGGNADRVNRNAFLNLMWTPTDRLMYGVEYGYYETELRGERGDASRIMVAAQYSF
ncbi:DcaP family trimeric outer membrane transporter [Halomonas sp. E19]|uniref:DcaP family trimeric outer membrane transporter n=1 Tax=Halomonas sp. E19 TaxID=3397247 RepID=UPI004033A008